MNNIDHAFPVFDFVTGWLIFLSFLCFCICVSTLRYHVDAKKLTKVDEINRALRSFIPDREVLTPSGLVRYKLAIISLLVSMGTAAIIIARKLCS